MKTALIGRPSPGGYDFAADPEVTANATKVFWDVTANPGMVVLTEAPAVLRLIVRAPTTLSVTIGRAALEGQYLTVGTGRSAMPVLISGGGHHQPPSLLVSFDALLPDRIATALRFWHLLTSHPPDDPRLTPQRRDRIRHILQAGDGRAEGASYREIAVSLFGEVRLLSEPWKTASIRDVTIRLVRDGQALIAGGYRSLLQYSRRS